MLPHSSVNNVGLSKNRGGSRDLGYAEHEDNG
jgi:hypothetical protein